jgi:hypothetical protein
MMTKPVLCLISTKQMQSVEYNPWISECYFTEPQTCAQGEYKCTNGQCMNSTQRCDLQFDCWDKSDELDCGEFIHTLFPILKDKTEMFTSQNSDIR